MLQYYTVANQAAYPISLTDAYGKLVTLRPVGTAGASARVPLSLATFNEGDFVAHVAASKLTLTPVNVGDYNVPNLANYPVSLQDSFGQPKVLPPQSVTPVTLTSGDATSDNILSLKAQGILGTLAAITAPTMPQSFLPVIVGDGEIVGLFAITPTTFDGTETTFDLSGLLTAGKTVNIQKISTGPAFPFLPRLSHYMGCVFTRAQEAAEAWASHLEFIPLKHILPASSWQQATLGPDTLRYVPGVMVYSLCYGNNAPIAVTTTTPAPTVNTPAALSWAVNAAFSNQSGLRFVDFNWVAAFSVSFPTLEPAYIRVVSNPAENDVKAFVISAGNQAANAGITQNTVRLVKVIQGAVAAGARAFTFSIVDRKGNEVAVTLNLTVS